MRVPAGVVPVQAQRIAAPWLEVSAAAGSVRRTSGAVSGSLRAISGAVAWSPPPRYGAGRGNNRGWWATS